METMREFGSASPQARDGTDALAGIEGLRGRSEVGCKSFERKPLAGSRRRRVDS